MKPLQELVRPNIWALKPYSSARDEYKGAAASVFLDANENPYNAPYNRYPDPLQLEVKEMLAPVKGVKPGQIFLGNGSDEAIDLAFRIFCEPKTDNVVAIAPTYGMYKVCADINDVAYRPVLLDDGFRLDADKLLAVADEHTKLVFLCSPNNPSGNDLEREEIVKVLERFPGMVVIDEAYAEYVRDPSFVSCKTLVDEGLENLCVLKTFSKIFAMAGMRLGFTYAAPAVVNKVRTQVAYDIMLNNSAIAAALVELEDKDFIPNSRKANEDARVIVCKTLDELGIEYLDSQTNFIFMNLKAPLKPFQDRMKAENILVGRPFPPAVEWCRVSLSTPDDMKYFAAKLKEFRRKGWV